MRSAGRFRQATLVLAGLLILQWQPAGRAKAPSPTFEQQVRPILKAHCFECHGEGKRPKGGLDLRLVRLMREGGSSGPALIAGQPAQSVLVQRLVSGEMPPSKKKLSAEEIKVIEDWIRAGAATARPEPESITAGFQITPEEQAFWSFQPIRRPAPPAVKAMERVRTPIDAFILAGLEAKGLTLSPEADRVTLIRRATFDLLGLPPTPEEVEAFVRDPAPDAYERLIDRLLASPHYGERWGRHWLDVAGYADSDGYTAEDPVRRFAYLYRDYVIRVFNADMPFDRFIQEQLAGDELVRPPYDRVRGPDLDKLIATGFLRMAPDGTTSKDVDQPLVRNQVVADTIQIVATSLMGLTVHCAQCHNHRYDPIPQTDYYSLRAILEPALDWKNWRRGNVTIFDEADRRRADAIELEASRLERMGQALEQDVIQTHIERVLAKIPPEDREEARAARAALPGRRSARQQELLRKYPMLGAAPRLANLNPNAAALVKQYLDAAAELRAAKPVPLVIAALTEPSTPPPPTFLFDRGDFQAPREAVPPAGLTVLAAYNQPAIPGDDPDLPTTGRRLAFARQLTNGTHPLTARVLVNRFWHHHFGRGIVSSLGDFGFLGERPSHPELLDWLASEFMAGGWRLKPLHKLIMTSSVYRQQSRRTPELDRVDPDNVLLGRMSIRRLEGETVRDAVLAVNGQLNRKQFGPPVPVSPDANGQVIIGVDTRDGAGRFTGKVVPLHGEEFRRSVYVQVRRSLPLALLATFDAPVMEPCCEQRNSSTVTPQALILMNSAFIDESARAFAARLRRDAADLRGQLEQAWRLAFAAAPTNAELEGAIRFVTEQTALFRDQKRADAAELALANYCQALLSANRFLYVD